MASKSCVTVLSPVLLIVPSTSNDNVHARPALACLLSFMESTKHNISESDGENGQQPIKQRACDDNNNHRRHSGDSDQLRARLLHRQSSQEQDLQNRGWQPTHLRAKENTRSSTRNVERIEKTARTLICKTIKARSAHEWVSIQSCHSIASLNAETS